MRIVYVTAEFPYGTGEAYFESELSELVRQGFEILVVPRSSRGLAPLVDLQQGWQVSPGPVLSPGILGAAVRQSVRHPRRVGAAVSLLKGDRSHLVRNLAVIPKAMWLAVVARRWGAKHIHAHWAGTTATMAMIAAELCHLSWSFTAHRWDVEDGNLAGRKVAGASFARVISENGLQLYSQRVPVSDREKIHVIHMGVNVPESPAPRRDTAEGDTTLICTGNLNEGKGHALLLEALAALKAKGSPDFVLLVAGDGPLRESLERKAASLGLEGSVRFLGHVVHDELMTLYRSGSVDIAVLPSEFEGIPVALMEVMGYGIPVIAAAVGGIPELCGDGCGVLVQSGDREELAEAIEGLLSDRERRQSLGCRGRQRVLEEFNVEKTVARVGSLMMSAQRGVEIAGSRAGGSCFRTTP